jgi:hypothetical protein
MKQSLAVLGFILLSAVAVSAQTLPAAPATPAVIPDLALVPAPQQAVACGPLLQTPLMTVGGSTCAQARHDLQGVLDTEANCLCGFCSRQFVEQPCRVIQGGYQVPGYIKYRCQICPI